MRQAGTIESKEDAQRFADYLLTLGISSKVESAGERWAIWIRDENQVTRSKQELDAFQLHPGEERYRTAEQSARQARREAEEKKRQAERNFVDVRRQWNSNSRRRPLTLTMIALCVALSMGILDASEGEFLFSWPLILKGEVWRLITPIFVHADLRSTPLHLIFNMWWLFDLGTLIETRLGTLRYAALVLVIALISNLGEFLYAGPNFVGMSGVVYGLFGYAWIRGRIDPTSGLYLQQQVVVMMMAWLVFCMVLSHMNVANGAHVAGLAAGAAIAYLVHGVGHWRRR
ncbi:MAG TPA: rhomboid family intramembrane serine protease [Pirellulales bacterium]|jgi:GlpG protein|nr:rhomboid family intramembrane serine protease [Pirellulales bacterium]